MTDEQEETPVTVITTVVSILRTTDDGEVEAEHLIDLTCNRDDAPDGLLHAVAKAAANAVLTITNDEKVDEEALEVE